MENDFCLKIKHVLTAVLILLVATISFAQNVVSKIEMSEDSPMEIKYTDGRVAKVLRREKVEQFRVPITLRENSCKEVEGLKCMMVIPYIRQQYAAIWKTHPTRQGQPLEYGYSKNVTFGSQTYITRTQDYLYETVLKRMLSIGVTPDKVRAAQAEKNILRIECEEDIAKAFPTVPEILFWDEKFESGNEELSMTEQDRMDGTRVNLNWRRFQNMNFSAKDNVVKIGRFKMDYGTQTDYYPIGLSYLTQMTFRAPNVQDPSKEICLIKWDMNFSVYFTQVLSIVSNGGYEAFDPEGYKPYTYTPENSNPHKHARRLYELELWQEEGMQ